MAHTITRRVALLAIPAAFVFGACGKIAEEAVERGTEELIERESGGEVDIDLDSDGGSISIDSEDGSLEINTDEDGTVTAESEDGSYTIGDGAELPDGFPDLPLPDGLTLQTSFGSGGDFQISGYVPGDAQEVYEDLVDAYRDAGHEPTGEYTGVGNGSFSGSTTFEDVDGATVNVSVIDLGDGTASMSVVVDG